jgi:hypothetical protein
LTNNKQRKLVKATITRTKSRPRASQ